MNMSNAAFALFFRMHCQWQWLQLMLILLLCKYCVTVDPPISPNIVEQLKVPFFRLRVSYCHWPMSVVRRPSSVVRRQQLL